MHQPFFFFEVAVCAFITSLFFFLFFFFKATFTFSSCLYYCLTCPWTVPDAPTFFLRWSSVLFITGFIFQSQSVFFFFFFFFPCFILHAMDSPGCTNLFFFYRIFFLAFIPGFFQSHWPLAPFNWLFFFQSHWLLASFNRLFSKP